MQIDLPQDLFLRVQQRVALLQGVSEADVIRKALDSLDWMDQESQAVQTGIDAWRTGNVQPLDDFDRDFRMRNHIKSDA